jgi:hypothetical protein
VTPEVPDSVIHWALGFMLPAGGAFFLFLLKRTFSDFEGRISDLFGQMKDSLKAQQDHDTRIQLLDLRVKVLEDKVK